MRLSPSSKRRLRVILIVVLVLAVIRIALPYVLLHFANQRLGSMPEHRGHINDLDLALIRGAYRLEGFHLDRRDSVSGELVPFLAADAIELSVEWSALFDGAIVGEIDADRPELRFTKDKAEPEDVQGDTLTLGALLEDFMPLRINRFGLHDGSIRYVDEGSRPPVDISLTNVEAEARNLTSIKNEEELLPAQVDATATLYGGALSFNMGLDPLSASSLFDMDLQLRDMDLPRVNELFQAYADFDVNKGRMSLFVELATKDGEITGYLKPVIKDLDVLGREDRHDNVFRKMWEGIVGTAATLLKNPRKEQVATKIPLNGRTDDPHVRTWVAVISVLRNAFVQALRPAIDRDVDLSRIGAEEAEGS
ncbi:MAG: DUF748 domain-containing protein [Flavobacteriales bacterium]|nr:DUF748 domain-containing protein [Flavobacteriales bacterium]